MRVTGPLLERAASRLPQGARGRLREIHRRVEARLKRFDTPKWGELRRLEPISDFYGLDRGTPIDRVYIEQFVHQHCERIRGSVVEVGDATLTMRFGGTRVSRAQVIDIDPSNRLATLVVDLDDPGAVPTETFDCIVLTQVLQFLRRPEVALRSLWEGLRVGGTMLVTVPSLSRTDVAAASSDHWRWTPAGLSVFLGQVLPEAQIDVHGLGNLITCVGFLHGIAAEELRDGELDHCDPAFPLLACARVTRRK